MLYYLFYYVIKRDIPPELHFHVLLKFQPFHPFRTQTELYRSPVALGDHLSAPITPRQRLLVSAYNPSAPPPCQRLSHLGSACCCQRSTLFVGAVHSSSAPQLVSAEWMLSAPGCVSAQHNRSALYASRRRLSSAALCTVRQRLISSAPDTVRQRFCARARHAPPCHVTPQ